MGCGPTETALDSGSSSPGSNPVFGQDTFFILCLSPASKVNAGWMKGIGRGGPHDELASNQNVGVCVCVCGGGGGGGGGLGIVGKLLDSLPLLSSLPCIKFIT